MYNKMTYIGVVVVFVVVVVVHKKSHSLQLFKCTGMCRFWGFFVSSKFMSVDCFPGKLIFPNKLCYIVPHCVVPCRVVPHRVVLYRAMS